MATVATLPFAKAPKGYNSNNKAVQERSSKTKQPTRSMTYPLHDPAKGCASKRCIKNGEPFDPEELSRRLTAHLTQQKAASRERREARAAKERALTQDAVYHHVPTVAAAAFHRTATPIQVSVDMVHKASAPVLKAALSPTLPFPDDSATQLHAARTLSIKWSTTALQRTVYLDQAERQKERVRNRNQFQHTCDMDEAAEEDELRDVYRAPQRTFREFAHLRAGSTGVKARPLSTGDVFSDSEAPDRSSPKLKVRAVAGYDGRNNWAQSDAPETLAVKDRRSGSGSGSGLGGSSGKTVKERVLKRKESVWVLMGKREKIKNDNAGECTSPPPLDGKRGFLARFRRQHSS